MEEEVYVDKSESINMIKPIIPHFTYAQKPDYDTLCQGDIIRITDELREVLETYHSYFINKQYTYFVVLTQSCDLVRRDGKTCKSPYITLAALRTFPDYLRKTIGNEYYVESVNGILLLESGNKEKKCYEAIERLYNNTEPDYFFLYHEDAFKFYEDMVAYLKVSIPLKSEHYDKCLAGKIMELSDEFKAKLGWLVGNMYSRVGTHDWGDKMEKSEREAMIQNVLRKNFIIANKSRLRKTVKELATGNIETKEQAMKYIEKIEVETNYDKAMKIISNCINNCKELDKDQKNKLVASIRSKKQLEDLIKSD